jgi:WD repeat-containing protein 6
MHLPVTALQTLTIQDRCFLLVGQGPHLQCYNAVSNRLLTSQQIFAAHPVHHISVAPATHGKQSVLVVGGRHLAEVRLHQHGGTGEDDDVEVSWISRSRTKLGAKEWVLSTTTCHHDGAHLLLTSNNTLFRYDPTALDVAGEGGAGAVQLFAQGPGSFLYSGDVVSTSPDVVLVASGSAFGEVLFWVCRKLSNGTGNLPSDSSSWKVTTTHRFEGHTGSIFGVTISEQLLWDGQAARFVATCSDDRTIQIWDVSDYEQPTDSEQIELQNGQNTGFGLNGTQNSRFRVAMGWGHQSRIWDVGFIPSQCPETTNACPELGLISRGEDGTCQFWFVSLPSRANAFTEPAKLVPVASDRFHSGKNVWSWAFSANDHAFELFSGGADGRVVRRGRSYPAQTKDKWPDIVYSIPFTTMPLDTVISSLKDYTIRKQGTSLEVLATTSQGEVFCLRPSGDKPGWTDKHELEGLQVNKICRNLPANVMIAVLSDRIFVQERGSGSWISEPLLPNNTTLAWASIVGTKPTDTAYEGSPGEMWAAFCTMKGSLHIAPVLRDHAGIYIDELTDFVLPEHFSATSCCYDHHTGLLVLGSRLGAVAVYRKLDHSSTMQLGFGDIHCVRSVHGKEAVTSLQILQSTSEPGYSFVLSTGRDGRYAIHRLYANGDSINLQTIHQSAPPFGPYIEGAHVRSSHLAPHRQELILHGFRSKDFVVWNESQQTQAFSVDCGGAHRSWAYESFEEAGSQIELFVHTKASTFNLHSQKTGKHEIVQGGGHGRETKAMAVRPSCCDVPQRGLKDVSVVATGAEDTTIRLFAISNGFESSALPLELTVLNDHSAGLQDLAFSPDGHYLFSCGGAEQLYAWGLTLGIPVLGVGVVLRSKMPRHDEDADVRIMSLDVSSVPGSSETGGGGDAYYVVAAYSNGKFKRLRYQSALQAGQDTWETLSEICLGSFCLMQVREMVGTTQGLVLAAGTNGILHLVSPRVSKRRRKPMMKVHPVHQSSVLAMDVMHLGPLMQLIVTGGDDNALCFTLTSKLSDTTVDDSAENIHETFIGTVRIKTAHAAALTAVKILSAHCTNGIYSVRVASAGNDQRVHLWEVRIYPVDTHSIVETINVRKLHSIWTGVADVSCIELVKTRLVVSGVGIEVLPLDLGG